MAEQSTLAIEIKGLPSLRRAVSPERLGKEVGRMIDRSALVVEGRVRALSPRDTGGGARSWRAGTTAQGWDRLGSVRNKDTHMAVLNVGRRPGARMPPPHVLVPWLNRHGIPASAAFVVARAIGRRGVKKYKGFVDKAVTASRPGVAKVVADTAGAMERPV